MIRTDNGEFISNPGSNIKDLYDPVVNKDGSIDLVKSGEENWQEYIDSFRDSCDIEVILKRFEMGDMSVMNQKRAMYGDFTDMPKTYAEVLQMQIDAEKAFGKMPVDVKEKFNNDINQFLAEAGTDEWYKKLGFKEKEDIKESEGTAE